MNGIVVLLDERRPTTTLAWFSYDAEDDSMDMNPLVENYAAALYVGCYHGAPLLAGLVDWRVGAVAEVPPP